MIFCTYVSIYVQNPNSIVLITVPNVPFVFRSLKYFTWHFLGKKTICRKQQQKQNLTKIVLDALTKNEVCD